MKNVLPWLIAGVSLISLVVVLLNREECAAPVAQAPAVVAPAPRIEPSSPPSSPLPSSPNEMPEISPTKPPAAPVVTAPPPVAQASQPSPILDIALTSAVQPITLKIRGGQLLTGPSRITVREGQDIELTVIADKIGELYLEGYEISTALYPNQRTVVAFKTDMTGTFKYVHTISGNTLGVLEVVPVN